MSLEAIVTACKRAPAYRPANGVGSLTGHERRRILVESHQGCLAYAPTSTGACHLSRITAESSIGGGVRLMSACLLLIDDPTSACFPRLRQLYSYHQDPHFRKSRRKRSFCPSADIGTYKQEKKKGTVLKSKVVGLAGISIVEDRGGERHNWVVVIWILMQALRSLPRRLPVFYAPRASYILSHRCFSRTSTAASNASKMKWLSAKEAADIDGIRTLSVSVRLS